MDSIPKKRSLHETRYGSPQPLGWSGSLLYGGKPQRQQDLVVLF